VKFQQVQYFLAVCEERSFTRAARRGGVAQPTVTKAIRDLEDRIGGALFVRKKLQQAETTPTSLGLALKPHFGRAIRSLQRAERVAARFNGHLVPAAQSPLD
jgi:DNA-binding transcriptional LysR family regulator